MSEQDRWDLEITLHPADAERLTHAITDVRPQSILPPDESNGLLCYVFREFTTEQRARVDQLLANEKCGALWREHRPQVGRRTHSPIQ